MCEPAHSIVQYPNDQNDDSNLPPSEQIRQGLGSKVWSWGKRIGSWFHFSKLGSGHTNAIELSGKASLILPEHTRYEGLWWNREFILDGKYHGFSTDKEFAYEVASKYHQQTVMGSMKLFRRFIETSINNSDRPSSYLNRLLDHVLTKKGGNQVLSKLKAVFGKHSRIEKIFKDDRNKAVKTLMGFTRKRNLFLPHFSDDDSIWI